MRPDKIITIKVKVSSLKDKLRDFLLIESGIFIFIKHKDGPVLVSVRDIYMCKSRKKSVVKYVPIDKKIRRATIICLFDLFLNKVEHAELATYKLKG